MATVWINLISDFCSSKHENPNNLDCLNPEYQTKFGLKECNLNSNINSLRGPFQQRFDNTLEEIKVKRQVYHKGTLVGNDVGTIWHSNNIKKIV